MEEDVRYYMIVGRGRSPADPSGLARRRQIEHRWIDQSLRRDLTWDYTSVIAEWNRGEELARDLIEISEEEAEALIEKFRERWGVQD